MTGISHDRSSANQNTEPGALKPGISLVLLLAGGLLVGFSMGRWLAPLAAWIGPVLIMRYARDHRAGRGFLLVLAACILAMFFGIGSFFAPPLGIVIVVSYGLLLSLPYLADRLMSARLPGFSSTFVYPLAATSLEIVNIHANPMGAWGATSFTQYGDLPLMQLASATGMIGITFLMGWFASVANWAWENRGRRGEVVRGLATFGVVLAVVYSFGFLRLNLAQVSKTDETIRVAGITAQTLSGIDDVRTINVQSHRDAYFGETAREAKAGAKVIVWPEISGWGLASDEASLITRAQEVARESGVYLAIPLYTFHADTGQPVENKLLVVDPTGAIVIEHIKFGGNLLEGSVLGDGKLQTVATPFGVLSGVICYDLDYPAVIQQAGRNGTGLMLVPSKDWFEIDPVHTHMAVFRAIENGMSLVRQTDAGLSMAVDAYGRVLAQTDSFGSTDRTMVAQVPTKHVATLYSMFGRWLEWIFLAGFLYILARAFFPPRDLA